MPCKILEHIICSHVGDHLDELQDLMCWRDRKVQVDVAVLDFAKAFDTVPHESFLGKLDHYGVSGNLYTWIKAFLTPRTQRVMVDGELSESVSVDSGVPQGTVLGPLLFCCISMTYPQMSVLLFVYLQTIV